MVDNILEYYKKHGALLTGHFLLSSGLHSDKYLQTELVMQYPFIAEAAINELCKKLYDIKFTTVVSPAIGGIRFGYEVARQLRRKSIFTERVDGIMTVRRGFEVDEGELCLLAEDVVTTGKSTKECMKAVEDRGAKIVAITSMIDRSNGAVTFDVPFLPLVSVSVNSYEADNCPLCREGLPLVKPGSRIFDKK